METKPLFLKWLTRCILVGLLLVGGYSAWLNARIHAVLADFRWQVPAQIYAQPVELFVGAGLSTERFRQQVSALGYTPVSRVTQPGQFSQSGATFRVFLRAFDYPDGKSPATNVVVRFDGGRIVSLEGASLARLEPQVIGQFLPGSREDRLPLPLAAFPKLLVDGIVAVEDRRFFQHHGLDPRGLARAVWANLRAGRVVEGGSTLTQQLVKNLFLTRERSYWRKANEALMALLVDAQYEKDFILQAYLNQVYLGQAGARAIHGFERAAQHWFGKPAAELNPSQIALLVGMVKGPSAYNPERSAERATTRRNAVLGVWQREGLLAQQAFDAARLSPLGAQSRSRLARSSNAFVARVKQELAQYYTPETLASDGLRVFTSLDLSLQRSLQQAAVNRLAQLETGSRAGLQVAAVVLSAATGEVKAIVGDRHGRVGGFDRAFEANRPVGSLLKPLVYLEAYKRGLNALSPVEDIPVSIETPQGPWQPQNYNENFEGQVPLFYALAKSKNLAAVNLAQDLGFDAVAKTAQQAGVDVDTARPSWILGGHSMTPMDVAQLYATLANDGFRVEPKLVLSVMTPDGVQPTRFETRPEPVLDSAAVYLLQQGLAQVMANGTGRFLHERLGRQTAGKSGTSNDLRDSWFAGFDADNVVVAWIGKDDNSPHGLTGSSGAGLVWLDAMRAVDGAGLSLRMPAGVELGWVDSQGRLSGESCPGTQQVPLLSSALPAAGQCGQTPGLWSRVRQIFGG